MPGRDEQENGQHEDYEAEENPVVHARDQLKPDERACQQAVNEGFFVECLVSRPERQRDETSPLQLEMFEMFDAVRHHHEDCRRDDACQAVAGQMTRQQEHTEAGCDDATEQEKVVDDDRARPRPEKRAAEHAFQDHGIRVRQRPTVRIKDVGVVQARGIGAQGVRDPRHPPRAEETIIVGGDTGREIETLRPREKAGEAHEERGQRGSSTE